MVFCNNPSIRISREHGYVKHEGYPLGGYLGKGIGADGGYSNGRVSGGDSEGIEVCAPGVVLCCSSRVDRPGVILGCSLGCPRVFLAWSWRDPVLVVPG